MLTLGYKFNPTDQEIVSHYLSKWVSGQDLCLVSISQAVRVLDIYSMEPWLLPLDGTPGHLPFLHKNQWFFFVQRQRASIKNINGKRPRRNLILNGEDNGGHLWGGWWKSTTGTKPILDNNNGETIGFVNTLNFFKYKNEQRKRSEAVNTSWIVHEYSLPGDDFQEWVFCRLKDNSRPKRHKKNASVLQNQIEEEIRQKLAEQGQCLGVLEGKLQTEVEQILDGEGQGLDEPQGRLQPVVEQRLNEEGLAFYEPVGELQTKTEQRLDGECLIFDGVEGELQRGSELTGDSFWSLIRGMVDAEFDEDFTFSSLLLTEEQINLVKQYAA